MHPHTYIIYPRNTHPPSRNVMITRSLCGMLYLNVAWSYSKGLAYNVDYNSQIHSVRVGLCCGVGVESAMRNRTRSHLQDWRQHISPQSAPNIVIPSMHTCVVGVAECPWCVIYSRNSTHLTCRSNLITISLHHCLRAI